MNKKNILLLGVGGTVSQGILKAIRASNLPCNIVGACISSDSAGLYLCDKAYISPYADSPEFIQFIIDVCDKEKINMIFTGVEEIIIVLAKHMDDIRKNTDAIFISADYAQLVIGQDKLLTSQWLEENGCNFPSYATGESEALALLEKEDITYPLIAKPRKGKGSQGILIIQNENDLKHAAALENYIIQEYIGSNETEYTVGCYCDKNGELVGSIIIHRTLLFGSTQKAVVVQNEDIEKETKKICKAFKPNGPLNIQLRLDSNGRPVCFELNVRFSGTTPIRAKFGFNDVAAMLKEYLFNSPIAGTLIPKKGTAMRFSNEIYILDDTVNELDKNKFISNMNEKMIYLEKFEGEI